MNPSRVTAATFLESATFSPSSVPGLALWTRIDAGVVAEADGHVAVWKDQSGQGNDLVPQAVTSEPVLVPVPPNGLPTLHFDGVDDWMKFTTAFNGTIRAVFAVLREDPETLNNRAVLDYSTTHDFFPGTATLWSGNANAAIRNGQTWLNGVPVDGTVTNRPKTMSVLSVVTTAGVTADRLFNSTYWGTYWKGDIAELIVYTQAPTDAQRKAVEDFLALKYASYAPYVATAGAPAFTPNGGVFAGTVTVNLTTPTPGADIRYTVDGNDPDESSPRFSGSFDLSATTTVKARAYHAGMSPSSVATATFLQSTDFTPASVGGLALWTRADAGITADAAGRVSLWKDQSGQGNDLVPQAVASEPLLVPGAQNHLPTIHFDGVDDWMKFTTAFSGTIRAVFAVLREDPESLSNRAVLDYSTTHDFFPGTATLWSGNTNAAIRNGQTWLNGVMVDGTTTNRPKAMSVLSVVPTAGVTADRLFNSVYWGTYWKGDIAELIIYTQPITAAQRKALEDYLVIKYEPFQGAASAPDLSPRGGLFTGPVTVGMSTVTPAAQIRYTLDGTEPNASSLLYTAPVEVAPTTTVKARAYRTGLRASAVSAGLFARPEDLPVAGLSGMALWAKADADVVADSNGRVSAWHDQSGQANDLTQATAGSQPLLVPGAANGLPTLHFDGTDDWLQFTTRLNGTVRAVFAVLREDPDVLSTRAFLGDSSAIDFYPGGTTLWSAASASAAVRSGQTRLNGVPVDGTVTDRPKILSVLSVVTTSGVSADRLFRDRTNATTSWKGDIAELIVFTQVPTSAQRKQVEDYLATKYGIYLATAAAPVLTPNGSISDDPVRVALSTETAGAQIYYTTDGSEPTPSSTLYTDPFLLTTRTTVRTRAFHPVLAPSPIAVATFLDGGAMPIPQRFAGLKLWVKGDAGITTTAGAVSRWADQSGNGNDLVQTTTASARPQFVGGAVNQLPVVRFDGNDDVLQFTSPLTTIRTVFWVVSRDSSATGYRSLLGAGGSYDFTGDGTTKIWDQSYTAVAVKNGETRIGGALVNGVATDRPTTLSVISLVTTGPATADCFSNDRGMAQRYWWGDLAELIIYDRPLPEAERDAVESYLAAKYRLGTWTLPPPAIIPVGPRVAGAQTVVMDDAIPGATIRYTTHDEAPEKWAEYKGPFDVTETTRIRAQAFLDDWNPSREAVVTVLADNTFTPASVANLALWVRADAGVSPTKAVVSWNDQGPMANHLLQSTGIGQPALVLDETSHRPLLRFDGFDDTLLFTTRLSTIRTVFWVLRASSPLTSGYHDLLGDANLFDFISGDTTKIWSTSFTNAFVLNGQTRINGAVVNGATTDRPTTLSVLSLRTTGPVNADAFSRDRTLGRSWAGDLAELVIYDRALSDAEVRSVAEYLAGRYGIGLAP
jgi:hypothetical protein